MYTNQLGVLSFSCSGSRRGHAHMLISFPFLATQVFLFMHLKREERRHSIPHIHLFQALIPTCSLGGKEREGSEHTVPLQHHNSPYVFNIGRALEGTRASFPTPVQEKGCGVCGWAILICKPCYIRGPPDIRLYYY